MFWGRRSLDRFFCILIIIPIASIQNDNLLKMRLRGWKIAAWYWASEGTVRFCIVFPKMAKSWLNGLKDFGFYQLQRSVWVYPYNLPQDFFDLWKDLDFGR